MHSPSLTLNGGCHAPKVISNQIEALTLVPGCTFRDKEGALYQVPSRQSLELHGMMHANLVEDYCLMLTLNDEHDIYPLTVIWEPDWDITFLDYAYMEINEDDGYPIGWAARQQAINDGAASAGLLNGAL
jgi:hypothetical protein